MELFLLFLDFFFLMFLEFEHKPDLGNDQNTKRALNEELCEMDLHWLLHSAHLKKQVVETIVLHQLRKLLLLLQNRSP